MMYRNNKTRYGNYVGDHCVGSLFNSLTIIRFTTEKLDLSQARPRLIIICLGLLIITLPPHLMAGEYLSLPQLSFVTFSRFVPLGANVNNQSIITLY